MPTDLTEEEMRLALFGATSGVHPAPEAQGQPQGPAVVTRHSVPVPSRKSSARLTPKLRVTLRVGNEFEGETELFIHEADTLSRLEAELEATKLARKKFRYIELVSVKPVT